MPEISTRQFNERMEDIATFDVAILAETDDMVYQIPMPKNEMLTRVLSGVDINEGVNDGNEITLQLYNRFKGNVIAEKSFEPSDTWEEQLLQELNSFMSSWREHVLATHG